MSESLGPSPAAAMIAAAISQARGYTGMQAAQEAARAARGAGADTEESSNLAAKAATYTETDPVAAADLASAIVYVLGGTVAQAALASAEVAAKVVSRTSDDWQEVANAAEAASDVAGGSASDAARAAALAACAVAPSAPEKKVRSIARQLERCERARGAEPEV